MSELVSIINYDMFFRSIERSISIAVSVSSVGVWFSP